ncbi:hypothetical protein V6N13_022902 [Hibiscus sabdariffa]
MHFRIFDNKKRSYLYGTAVYASPSASGKKFLWPHLEHISSTIRGPWIAFGDFNATRGPANRKGCAASSKPNKSFQNLLYDNGLWDMGYIGHAFTWSRGNASIRLDRFICNSYFDEAFPTAVVHHLMLMRSDHRPIMLQIGNISCSSWVSPFSVRLPRNQKMNGNGSIAWYSKSLSCRSSRFLSNLEATLLIELEHLLDQEELLWKQKSRPDWISQGDRSTRYFHRREFLCRQRNKIMSLEINDGTLCEDKTILKKETARFF